MGIGKISRETQLRQQIEADSLQASQSMQNTSGVSEASEALSNHGLEGRFDGADISQTKSSNGLGKTPEEKFLMDIEKAMESPFGVNPAGLKAYVNQKVTDEELRKRINSNIEMIEYAVNAKEDGTEQYVKLYTNGGDKVRDAILNVYIHNEVVKAEADLVRIADKKTGSYEQKLEQVKSEYKTNGDPYREAALKGYEEHLINIEMETRLIGVLRKMEKEGKLDGYYGYSEKLKNAIVAEAGGDKEFKKFVRKYGQTYVEIATANNKVMKRQEELTHVTEEEIKKGSSKDNPSGKYAGLNNKTIKAIGDYAENHKTTSSDGKVSYDLSEISKVILGRIGADKLAMGTKSIDSELKYIKYDLERLPGIDKLSDKEVKDLIVFCGADYITREHKFKPWEYAKAFANGLVVGTAVHITAPKTTEVLLNVYNYNQNITHILDESGVLLDTFDSGQIQGNTFSEIFEVNAPGDIVKAVTTGAVVSLIGALVFDLISFAIGTPYDKEDPCFNLLDTIDVEKSKMKNKKEYIEYLQGLNDGQYERIRYLLELFPAKPDGSWDYEGFRKFMAQIAGPGSPLSCREIIGGKLYLDMPETEKTKPHVEMAERQVPKVEEKKVTRNTPPKREDAPEENVKFTKYAKNSSWEHLVDNVYGCDSPNLTDLFDTPKTGNLRSRRVLKIVQAITNGDYSYENIKKLLDMSYSGQLREGIEGFDYNEYLKYLKAKTMPSVLKLPKEIAGVKRCDMSDESVLIAGKAGRQEDNGIRPEPKFFEKPGSQSTYTELKVTSSKEYYMRDDKGVEKTYKDEDLRKVEYSAWKKANPEGTYTDYKNDIKAFNEAKKAREEAGKKENE